MDYTKTCRTNDKSGIQAMEGAQSNTREEKDATADYMQGLNQANSTHV